MMMMMMIQSIIIELIESSGRIVEWNGIIEWNGWNVMIIVRNEW